MSDRPPTEGGAPLEGSAPLTGSSVQRLTAAVHGRVQGVGFRWFVDRTARQLGLTGWVANRADGSVELVAEGAVRLLDEFVEALQSGPPGATVERVDQRRGPATREYARFHIRAGWHPGD